jgi:hypothetical protein
MGKKRKPAPKLYRFIDQAIDLNTKLDVLVGEATQWLDLNFFGKDYREVFREQLESEDYEVLDFGKVQNGSFKKIIQLKHDPFFQFMLLHDKDGVLNTILMQRP